MKAALIAGGLLFAPLTSLASSQGYERLSASGIELEFDAEETNVFHANSNGLTDISVSEEGFNLTFNFTPDAIGMLQIQGLQFAEIYQDDELTGFSFSTLTNKAPELQHLISLSEELSSWGFPVDETALIEWFSSYIDEHN